MSERKLPTIYTCFPGGKHKVLTMSYDDGKLEDRRLVSIFNKYGIKGTFHLNSGREMDTRIPTSEYQELYKGHEVSCHTLTHPTIAKEGRVFEEVIAEIASIVDGPISGEVKATTTDAETMIKDGIAISKIHQNMVVKIPIAESAFVAFKPSAVIGIFTTMF